MLLCYIVDSRAWIPNIYKQDTWCEKRLAFLGISVCKGFLAAKFKRIAHGVAVAGQLMPYDGK